MSIKLNWVFRPALNMKLDSITIVLTTLDSWARTKGASSPPPNSWTPYKVCGGKVVGLLPGCKSSRLWLRMLVWWVWVLHWEVWVPLLLLPWVIWVIWVWEWVLICQPLPAHHILLPFRKISPPLHHFNNHHLGLLLPFQILLLLSTVDYLLLLLQTDNRQTTKIRPVVQLDHHQGN